MDSQVKKEERKASLFTNSSLKSNRFNLNGDGDEESVESYFSDEVKPKVHKDFCDMGDEDPEHEVDSQALNRAQSEIIPESETSSKDDNAELVNNSFQ